MSVPARAALLETRLHALLPGPHWLNGAIIALAAFASYVGWSLAVGEPVLVADVRTIQSRGLEPRDEENPRTLE